MIQFLMKTYTYTFHNNNFKKKIEYHLFINEKNILVQIFCGHNQSTLAFISNEIQKQLPEAFCIGTTTDGEINNEKVSTLKTIIAISVFQFTFLKSHIIEDKDPFSSGYEMAKNVITSNTKLIITFTDGTSTNAEEYLKGIEKYNNKIMVCGGMAGDNGMFKQTYISLSNNVISKGAVAISLNSDILKVSNAQKFDWLPIGVGHTIDEVVGNRIYKISGMSAQEFYEKYLGTSFVQAEYPLIVKKNNIYVARAVLTKYDDGSLSCGGNLFKGDIVKLGFANAQMLMENPIKYIENIHSLNTETFFIYSCMARRRYMQNLIKVEIEPFANIATSVGFFTYAEFYHNVDRNELLNQTLTFVSLSENTNTNTKNIEITNKQIGHNKISYVKTVQSLTHLIQRSVIDYQEQSKKLEEEKNYSNNLLKSQKEFLRYAVHETNTPLAVIMSNIELYEMENGKNKYLSNIEVALKNIFSIYDDLSYLVKKDQISYPKLEVDLVDFIRSRIDFFLQVANKFNTRFIFEHKENELFIYFNTSKLQRIIDNNLTNAIKYTLENKNILISLEKEDNTCKLIISSYSKQIQYPERIFEEYYREAKAKDGFGLGLNLVKRICDEENVEIVLETNKNITSFTYIFKEYLQ